MRRAALLLLLAVAGWAALVGYGEYANSRNVPMPSDAELRAGFAQASGWILRNKQSLLEENNAMLWLFVREAARVSGEEPLAALARDYQSRYLDRSLWRFVFDSSDRDRVRYTNVALGEDLPDYNRLILYGATCNVMLGDDPLVHSLLAPAACDSGLQWLRSPVCRTHQLMGLLSVQKNHCVAAADITPAVARVQQLILGELRWDFRVEDAYIQKVLMLAESGRRGDLRGVWVRRILDAQRPGGGWDGIDVIARFPGEHVLCWADGVLYPRVLHQRPSTLHPTAQGLYLLALLLQKQTPPE
jgi:hypothetical protein